MSEQPTTHSDNSRIAKNTLFLYFRMLLVMFVTLYTSRVVLQQLGIDDYGIYNLVGGIVVLFSFLKGAVTTAIQRYLNFSIGKNDASYEQRVFSNSLVIFICFIGIILILLETIGLWIINYKLSIPADRIFQANILYQLSILAFVFNIYRIPYDALIIAHERMSFYAYASIIESVLKLAIVYLLIIMAGDKLITYGAMIAIVTLLVNCMYIAYTRIKFPIKSRLKIDTALTKEMLSFSGWNILGGLADVGYQQGTSLILNVFYGVAFNATMGIANQVKTAIFSFVGNLLTASNPQIIKQYASGKIELFQSLVLRVSKFAYFLTLSIAIPLTLNMDYILNLWLDNIPPQSTIFCQLMVIFCTLNSLTGPLWTAAQAHGIIRKYQIITSSILLMNLPLTYLFLQLGFPPISLLVIQIVLVIVSTMYRIVYLRNQQLISYRNYIFNVLIPISIVTLLSVSSTYLFSTLFESGFYKLFFVSLFSTLISGLCILLCGLDSNERTYVLKHLNRS